jgi:1-acyl-sn-glycerol-3-phosphate acyltransferase
MGEESLLASVWRTLSGPAVTAVVRYGQAELPQGRDRRQLAADLRAAVAQLRRT